MGQTPNGAIANILPDIADLLLEACGGEVRAPITQITSSRANGLSIAGYVSAVIVSRYAVIGPPLNDSCRQSRFLMGLSGRPNIPRRY